MSHGGCYENQFLATFQNLAHGLPVNLQIEVSFYVSVLLLIH